MVLQVLCGPLKMIYYMIWIKQLLCKNYLQNIFLQARFIKITLRTFYKESIFWACFVSRFWRASEKPWMSKRLNQCEFHREKYRWQFVEDGRELWNLISLKRWTLGLALMTILSRNWSDDPNKYFGELEIFMGNQYQPWLVKGCQLEKLARDKNCYPKDPNILVPNKVLTKFLKSSAKLTTF